MSDPLRPHGLQPGLPVHHHPPEFTQTHVHWVSDAIQPSHPLSSPSPAFSLSQHQCLSKWVSSSHQVAKVLDLHLTGVQSMSTDPSFLQIFALTCSSLLIFAYPSSYPLGVPSTLTLIFYFFELEISLQHGFLHSTGYLVIQASACVSAVHYGFQWWWSFLLCCVQFEIH